MGAEDLPANDIFTVRVRRIRGEVTDDVEVRISSDHVGCKGFPRAGEDLDGGRADSPMKLKGTYTKVDGVRRGGNMVRVEGMASGGLADDVLVRGIDERDEGTLALEFQRAQLGQGSQGGIAGAATLSQGTFDACANRLDTSAAEVPGEA